MFWSHTIELRVNGGFLASKLSAEGGLLKIKTLEKLVSVVSFREYFCFAPFGSSLPDLHVESKPLDRFASTLDIIA